MTDGKNPETARRDVLHHVSASSLRNWRKSEWRTGLQEVVLGEAGIAEVLGGRLGAIDRELPAEFRNGIAIEAASEALNVSPGDTTALLVETKRGDLLADGMNQLLGNIHRSNYVIASAFKGAVENGGWEASPEIRPMAAKFARRYREADPQAAEAWLSSLPSEVAGELKGGAR